MKEYKVYFLIASNGHERFLTFEARSSKDARNKFMSMYGNVITKVERSK